MLKGSDNTKSSIQINGLRCGRSARRSNRSPQGSGTSTQPAWAGFSEATPFAVAPQQRESARATSLGPCAGSMCGSEPTLVASCPGKLFSRKSCRAGGARRRECGARFGTELQ